MRNMCKAGVLGCLLMLFCGCFAKLPASPTPTELGIPLAERYPQSPSSRLAWDMTVYDGKLYVGGGNYITNAGPVPVCAYDMQAGAWTTEGELPDEEINRFLVLDGQLAVPGTDPQGDWSFGNYYVKGKNGWETVRTIPGGVHTFDVTEFEDKLFAGIGVARGGTPIRCSADGGKTFEAVPMVKDGQPIDTTEGECIRTYDFFIVNDTLYATLWYENQVQDRLDFDVYRYENGTFVFLSTWVDKLAQLPLNNTVIGGKGVFRDTLYFTTGYLFLTSDMQNIQRVQFPHEEVVWDVVATPDALYVLTGLEQEEGWRVSVWKNASGEESDFVEVLRFDYTVPAMSFAVADEGDTFFFGMGQKDADHTRNGMVLMCTL